MPKLVKLGILLCLVWLVALGADALGVDWLLLIALWGGLAAILRAGHNLLDRLVLAALLGLGLLAPAGILLSLWSFGLRPALIGGMGLSAIVAVGVLGDRPPRLPAPRWSDALPVLTAAAIGVAVARPYLLANGFAGRLAVLMSGEDTTRHAALVDFIRASGRYSFLSPQHDSPIVMPGMRRYPQGWHFSAATVENFLRSSTELGNARAGLTFLMVLMLATFGLLILTILWGAGYLLGRKPSPIGYAATVLVGGWLIINSELIRTVVYGYPAEMLGLTFIAGLAVIVARPVAKVRVQVLLLAAMMMGVGFAYYLFLPPAALMVAWAVYADRRRLRAVPKSLLLGLLAGAVALLPAVVGVVGARQDENLTVGGLGAVNQLDIVILAGLVGAGLIARHRDPVWRRLTGPLVAVVGAAAAINLYSRLAGQQPAYYYGKMLHLVVVVLLVGIGVLVAPLLIRLPKRLAIPAALLAGALLVGSQTVTGHPSLTAVPWFSSQVSGRYAQQARADLVVSIDDACPAVPGLPTTVFYGSPAKRHGYYESIFLGPLQHTSGETAAVTYALPKDSAESRLTAIATRANGPFRVVVGDELGKAAIAELSRSQPDLAGRMTVVDLDGIIASGRCDPLGTAGLR